MSNPDSSLQNRVLPFHFSGSALEYFKIWIVNMGLTIITLGIYSAWAKVRRMRYFYGNTRVDDNVFNYLADPIRILKGRVVAVSALIIYSLSWDFYPEAGMLLLAFGVLMIPFLLVTATSFQMRNSAYCHIQFYFRRSYADAYRMVIIPIGIMLLLTWAGYSLLDYGSWLKNIETEDGVEIAKNDLLPSIFLLTMMPVFPYLDYVRSKFIINHTQFGQRKAVFSGMGRDFYVIYIIAFLLMMIVSILTAIVIAIMIFFVLLIAEDKEAATLENIQLMIVSSIVVFYSLSFFVSGYVRAALTNLIFEKTTFGELRIRSRLKSIRVGWIYLSNTIAIICSLTLLIPWAKIRMAKYVADCTKLETKEMGGILAEKQHQSSAMGEEIVDAFDIDLGL